MQETDEAKDVQRLYESISSGLTDFEAELYGKWGDTVEATSTEKLTLPLLTRESRSGELSVNFDPLLVKLLSEVKYFVVQGKDIPEVAADLYARAEKFRVQRGTLEIIKLTLPLTLALTLTLTLALTLTLTLTRQPRDHQE